MGGVESYLMNLYRNIDKAKIQFDFVVEGTTCYYSDEIKKLGGKIFYITPKKENVLANIRDLLKIFKMSRQTHKIVYLNLSVLYYNFPFIFAKFYRYPIIISHAHMAKGNRTRKSIKYYLHCFNRIYVAYASNYLFACSKSAGEWIFGSKIVKKGKVKVIPNSIYVERYKYQKNIRDQIRMELGLNKQQFVIGNVSRFAYVKNHDFLLDIFNEIIKMNNNALLLLVGDGELRNKIEEKISKLGLSKYVKLLGVRSDVNKLLQAMDVFVLPSYYEGLPVTLIEAQASGLKCFVSKDVVTTDANITGLIDFIELSKSSKYWAELIIKYVDGYERKDTSEIIKEAGYDIIEMAKNFQDFILGVEK